VIKTSFAYSVNLEAFEACAQLKSQQNECHMKVIQGILQGHKDTYHTKDSILQLFCHECLRTYGDRMFDSVDHQWLKVLNFSCIATFSSPHWLTYFIT
jgi:hypothetical protein